jgi:hypothetical protein
VEKRIKWSKSLKCIFNIDVPIFRGTMGKYSYNVTIMDVNLYKISHDPPSSLSFILSKDEIVNVSGSYKLQVSQHINTIRNIIVKYAHCSIIMNQLVKNGIIPMELAHIIKYNIFEMYQQQMNTNFEYINIPIAISNAYANRFG